MHCARRNRKVKDEKRDGSPGSGTFCGGRFDAARRRAAYHLMDALHTRWSAAHASTLPLVRALVAPEAPPVAAALSRLPAGTLSGDKLALALAREAAGRSDPAEALNSQLDELETILDDMHALAREAQAALANGPADGDGPAARTLADRAARTSAPLRCYEAELAMKRWIAEALSRRVSPPPAQVQALLVAWQCQPMVEPVDDMRADDMAAGLARVAVAPAGAARI